MHIIDLNRLAEVWQISWEQIEEFGDVLDEDEFLFVLRGGQVFSLNHKLPNEIHFWCNAHGKTTDSIGFNNITRVVYSSHRQAIAIESVGENFFSDMVIKESGKFSIEIGKSKELYSKSFCEILSKESK